jgi:uncharacterized protein (TIGR03067 family)
MTRYAVPMLIAGLLVAAGTVLVADPLVAAAPAPKEDDDAKKFQGTWRCVSCEIGGAVHKEGNDFICVIEKDMIAFKAEDKRVKWTFTLDPLKKLKTITLTFKEEPLPQDKPKVLYGIYEIDEDGLKWCLTDAGEKDRPTAFTTKEDSTHELFTFKKEKP